jgi:very-short-patch-repair endonuclease
LRVRTQVRVAEVGRVDLIIGDRLVIEADGREWHEGSVAFETDRARDLTLLRKGYVVIRLSYTQIMTEWALVEASIRALIELGEHRWRPGHYRAGLAG